ncbi:hypothetical protein RFI_10006 [Reticulomyxa filosa]|uniref:Uncharacterized protein n=1 Tax=Reticulomyxa filosa TaxID=46433 RepID=X6NN32_RETFI|nr:hypothetical protein RFI_10006 [Reticulomyxa filosa]|eukprot:ETO27124.1 hypothetical protein RFI_10006 [Reticulomyxa filosa]
MYHEETCTAVYQGKINLVTFTLSDHDQEQNRRKFIEQVKASAKSAKWDLEGRHLRFDNGVIEESNLFEIALKKREDMKIWIEVKIAFLVRVQRNNFFSTDEEIGLNWEAAFERFNSDLIEGFHTNAITIYGMAIQDKKQAKIAKGTRLKQFYNYCITQHHEHKLPFRRLEFIAEGEEKENFDQDIKIEKQKIKTSLLFVGLSGHGKTTLFLAIRDYLQKKKLREVKSTIAERRGRDVLGGSRTEKPEQIQMNTEEYEVILTDTVGINDAETWKIEEKNLNNLHEFLKTLKTCINNVIVVLTCCDDTLTPSTETLQILKKLQIPTQHVVCVNNIAYNIDVANSEARESIIDRSFWLTQQQIAKLLSLTSKFPFFRGSNLLELRRLQLAIIKKQEELKEIRENILSLLKAKQVLRTEYNQEKVDVQTFVKRKEIKLTERVKSSHLRLICAQCPEDTNECHNPCEIRDINQGIHNCRLFSNQNFGRKFLVRAFGSSTALCSKRDCGHALIYHSLSDEVTRTVSKPLFDENDFNKFQEMRTNEKFLEEAVKSISDKIKDLKIKEGDYNIQLREMKKDFNKMKEKVKQTE